MQTDHNSWKGLKDHLRGAWNAHAWFLLPPPLPCHASNKLPKGALSCGNLTGLLMYTSQDEAWNKTKHHWENQANMDYMITSHDAHAPLYITTQLINHSLYKHRSKFPMCSQQCIFALSSTNTKVPCLKRVLDWSALRLRTAKSATCTGRNHVCSAGNPETDPTLHTANQVSAGVQQHLQSLWEEPQSSMTQDHLSSSYWEMSKQPF